MIYFLWIIFQEYNTNVSNEKKVSGSRFELITQKYIIPVILADYELRGVNFLLVCFLNWILVKCLQQKNDN